MVVSFHKVDNLKLAAYLGQSLVNKIKVHIQVCSIVFRINSFII